MALSNRDRINQMFELMSPELDEFLGAMLHEGWVDVLRKRDIDSGRTIGSYNKLDPQIQFRALTEMPARAFREVLSQVHLSYASELRDVRNKWAHHEPITTDDAYRALDTGERLLTAIGAPKVAEAVQKIRLDLRRVSAESTDKKQLAKDVNAPASEGLKPWREVLQPHHDVASGNFQASEFAADLFKVSRGETVAHDYSDPTEFFSRTYLTEGLRDLITRTVRRLAGDPNASPVINLQTNFGGGKTHSMLALWHLAARPTLDTFPQATQEVLAGAGYADIPTEVRRVAIVGNHIAPSGETKPDGTQVNTIWGELAWQLGGKDAYALVADADRTGTAPGHALHQLLQQYAPAVILIDEWVAYARQLYDRDSVAGGTFDTQFTFAQALTEAAKATPGVLLAISIPASYDADDAHPAAGSAEEVGGTHGLEALARLQNVVRRVADQWRPASSEESYHIVRQRLFVQPDAAALAAINGTAKAFGDFYRKHPGEFPKEALDHQYENRIKQTYPIHPELFDRLYQDWSSLERFQRTRGVLRLMNAVIHALWAGGDQSAMILPGVIPLAVDQVNTELTQYLPDSWKAVIDADVDGAGSEPWRIDSEKPLFGQRSLTKRLARTVFFGSAPTHGAAHKGLQTQRVFLGTAAPGDVAGNFHTALSNLGDRATYFYSANGRYWYDLQANITRRARDLADRLHPEDVWAEVSRRLRATERTSESFTRIHICPEDSSDILDVDEARLVIVHPRTGHRRGDMESAAAQFATQATQAHGSAQRTNRNMLVYMAADEGQFANLDVAVRDYLGWSEVLRTAAELDLSPNQKQQAEDRRAQADRTVADRLALTYIWLLVPEQKHGDQPFTLAEFKTEGSGPLALRAAKKLATQDLLRTRVSANAVRHTLNGLPTVWDKGFVRLGDLWDLHARYPHMPRMRDIAVLIDGVTDWTLTWQHDAFALAAGVDDAGRFQGLFIPTVDPGTPVVTASTLLVKPELAIAQREAERPELAPATEETRPTPGVPGLAPEPQAPEKRQPTRYFGSRTLNPDRYAVDFKHINDEILVHLASTPGVRLSVRLEIEAVADDGFDDGRVRTVSENSQTLKFDQAGFED